MQQRDIGRLFTSLYVSPFFIPLIQSQTLLSNTDRQQCFNVGPHSDSTTCMKSTPQQDPFLKMSVRLPASPHSGIPVRPHEGTSGRPHACQRLQAEIRKPSENNLLCGFSAQRMSSVAGRRASPRAYQGACGPSGVREQTNKRSLMNGQHLGIAIAVGNQKGGVGKTSNCIHIAAALGQRGYQCLVMDLDPAAGATKHLGVPVNSYAGTLELLTTDESLENLVVVDTMPRGMHLVPSRPQLSEIDNLVSKYVDKTRILERPVHEARSRYDFIFLDTGPSAAFSTTVAAYSTAEWFLLSAFAHPLSVAGITEALCDVGDVRKHRNPSLEILGVVFSAIDGRATRLRAQVDEVVNSALPGRRFDNYISNAIVLPDTSGIGKTLFQLPKFEAIPVAQQYLRLSVELEHRARNREAFLAGTLQPPDYTNLAENTPLTTPKLMIANA